MVNKLMIESGYYVLIKIDTNIEKKVFTINLGEAYQEDGLKSISITDDGRFLRYFENDQQMVIRDSDLSKTFEETAANYINLLLQRFPKNSIIHEVDGVYVNYFGE